MNNHPWFLWLARSVTGRHSQSQPPTFGSFGVQIWLWQWQTLNISTLLTGISLSLRGKYYLGTGTIFI